MSLPLSALVNCPLLPLLLPLQPPLPVGSIDGNIDGKSKWRIGRQQGRQAQMIPVLDSMIVHMEEAMSSTKILSVAIKAYML